MNTNKTTRSFVVLLAGMTTLVAVLLGVAGFVGNANAAPLTDIVTENTSYIVLHNPDGDRVSLLGSGPDGIIDVTVEQVCAADNVRSVTVWSSVDASTTVQCK
jgi:hypothetical protein